MDLQVGQEYIDKNGTIYRIDIISGDSGDSVVSYSICDNREKNAYYHAGSAYIATFEGLILNGSIMLNNRSTKVLYGKD